MNRTGPIIGRKSHSFTKGRELDFMMIYKDGKLPKKKSQDPFEVQINHLEKKIN